MPEAITCPSCHYERQPTDDCPDYECPQCGIIYEKALPKPPRPVAKSPARAIPSAWQQEALAQQTQQAVPAAELPDLSSPPEPAAKIEEQRTVAPEPRTTAATPSKLIDCGVCGGLLSYAAASCPHCGHPNPEGTKMPGIIAGIIALSLAVDGTLMPYFAACFLVPAAFAAAMIAGLLRARAIAVIAALIACVGLWGIYDTSKQIKSANDEIQRSLGRFR